MIETELPVGNADEAFAEDGRLANLELQDRYVEILDELIALAEQTSGAESIAA